MPDHPELADRIAALQAEGKTLQAIADTLNAEGVIPTVPGGAIWRPWSVRTAARYARPTKRATRDQLPFISKERGSRG
jgi:hypothetical protein